MNLKELLQYYKEELAGIYDEQETIAIFDLLVAHVSGFSRRELLLKGISTEVQDEFTLLNYLTDLKRGKPVQYVLGETVFFGLRFLINSNVLIPRPETEELVEWVIESCEGLKSIKIVDIGTGSGCIAISLKKNISGSTVLGVDISKEALETAKANALSNEVDVKFFQGDVLDSAFYLKNLLVSGGNSLINNKINDDSDGVQSKPTKFDVVVSNPPYITPREKLKMHQNVMDYEPHLALFVSEEKPLVFYEAIADFAKARLKLHGLLFFEINEHLGEETVAMLNNKSFVNIELRKDMQGKNRMIRCSLGS